MTIQTAIDVANDVVALVCARNPLLWVVTREEARAERYLVEAAFNAGSKCRTWDVAQGVCEIGDKPIPLGGQDPGETLTAIRDQAKRPASRCVWIMRDLPAWLVGPGGAPVMRQLRNLCRALPSSPTESAQSIIVLTPSADVPPELAGHTTVIEFPLPDREEIGDILDVAMESVEDQIKEGRVEALNGKREMAIDAAIGLTGEEAASCYGKSLVSLKKVDPVAVAQEKKRVIARERVLEWFDPLPGGLDAVGGLENLKGWLASRAAAFTPEAREYGLPMPKGVLLVGVPGCGKSLTAKAIATAWGVPLLRVDLGALKSKFVGESEANLRKAFKVIEAIGRCVVWFDEVEKALAGATQGAADGGVSSDALGGLLSWMNDRTGGAFVVATANDYEALPPEFTRKGRFDEMFFVDLPNASERMDVLKAAIRSTVKQTVKGVDFVTVAQATEGFTGSEIAALVPDAMFLAFKDKARPITTADLLVAAGTVVPLSKTAEVKITKLRDWAKGRARSATARVADDVGLKPVVSKKRVLDMGR